MLPFPVNLCPYLLFNYNTKLTVCQDYGADEDKVKNPTKEPLAGGTGRKEEICWLVRSQRERKDRSGGSVSRIWTNPTGWEFRYWQSE